MKSVHSTPQKDILSLTHWNGPRLPHSLFVRPSAALVPAYRLWMHLDSLAMTKLNIDQAWSKENQAEDPAPLVPETHATNSEMSRSKAIHHFRSDGAWLRPCWTFWKHAVTVVDHSSAHSFMCLAADEPQDVTRGALSIAWWNYALRVRKQYWSVCNKWQYCVSRKTPKLPAKISTVLLYWSGF